MTNNVVHLQAFTELPSITELQNLLDNRLDIVDFGLFLNDVNTLTFPVELINTGVETHDPYNKHYYLDYSHKRKKGKLKKYG